jgi:flagellar motor protein MotB
VIAFSTIAKQLPFWILLSGCAALQPKPPAHYDQLIAQQDREISALLQRQLILRQHLESCDDPTQSPPAIFHELKQVLGPMGIEITRKGRTVTVHMPNKALFLKGTKPRIRKDAKMLLDLLSTALKLHADHRLVVEAHSDNQRTGSSSYPTNWELGAVRAAALTRELVGTYKVEPGRFTVSSRAEMDPISENSTPEGRASNRRILLHIIPRSEE